MKRFKEGVDNTMPFIMLISVLLMNVLLITGMMKVFFGWDPTILAGVIAFVGAVLGGAITLMGVNKTINENRKGERIKELKMDLRSVEDLYNRLYELYANIYPVEFTRAQELNKLRELRSEVNSITNSPETFILGDNVNRKISELRELIITSEMVLMADKKIIESPLIDIIFEIGSCFSVFEKKREELREEYKRLQAL